MEARLDFLPNAFYDLIVFTSSTVTFWLAVTVGLGWLNWEKVAEASAFDVVLIGVAIVVVGYEYGRIAEAWSRGDGGIAGIVRG